MTRVKVIREGGDRCSRATLGGWRQQERASRGCGNKGRSRKGMAMIVMATERFAMAGRGFWVIAASLSREFGVAARLDREIWALGEDLEGGRRERKVSCEWQKQGKVNEGVMTSMG